MPGVYLHLAKRKGCWTVSSHSVVPAPLTLSPDSTAESTLESTTDSNIQTQLNQSLSQPANRALNSHSVLPAPRTLKPEWLTSTKNSSRKKMQRVYLHLDKRNMCWTFSSHLIVPVPRTLSPESNIESTIDSTTDSITHTIGKPILRVCINDLESWHFQYAADIEVSPEKVIRKRNKNNKERGLWSVWAQST